MEGKNAWHRELCVVMYGEKHLFIGVLFVLFVCVMYNVSQKFSKVILVGKLSYL